MPSAASRSANCCKNGGWKGFDRHAGGANLQARGRSMLRVSFGRRPHPSLIRSDTRGGNPHVFERRRSASHLHGFERLHHAPCPSLRTGVVSSVFIGRDFQSFHGKRQSASGWLRARPFFDPAAPYRYVADHAQPFSPRMPPASRSTGSDGRVLFLIRYEPSSCREDCSLNAQLS